MPKTPIRPQQYHLSWPLTPAQVEGMEEMFQTLFKRLRALGNDTSDASVAGGFTAGPILGQFPLSSGLDGDEGPQGIPGIQGPVGPQGIQGVPGQDGQDGDDAVGSFQLPNVINTGWTQGSVIFGDLSGRLMQDNANFFWDATNHRLGIKTAAPTHSLEVKSTDQDYALFSDFATASVYLGTDGSSNARIKSDNSQKIRLMAGGSDGLTVTHAGTVGIQQLSPTAALHLPAGTATANTAPLKFTSGVSLTAPEAGTIEFTTDSLFFTITTGPTRKTIAFIDSTLTGTWNGTKIGLAFGGTNADLSGTGGANQLLKQSSAGAAITVGTISSSALSDSSNLAYLNTTNAFTAAGNPAISTTASEAAAHHSIRINNTNTTGFSTLWLGAANDGLLFGGSTAAAFASQLALITSSGAVVVVPGGSTAMITATTAAASFAITQNFSWVSKAVDTVYQAASDGFMVATIDCSAGVIFGYLIGYTDSSNPPTTKRGGANADGSTLAVGTFTMPVKKGDFYKAESHTGSGSPVYTVWWVPLGTAG